MRGKGNEPKYRPVPFVGWDEKIQLKEVYRNTSSPSKVRKKERGERRNQKNLERPPKLRELKPHNRGAELRRKSRTVSQKEGRGTLGWKSHMWVPPKKHYFGPK